MTQDARLNEIKESLNELRQIVLEIRACVPYVERRLERLEKEVWGNGQVGLSARVNAILWLLAISISMVGLSLGLNIQKILPW